MVVMVVMVMMVMTIPYIERQVWENDAYEYAHAASVSGTFLKIR